MIECQADRVVTRAFGCSALVVLLLLAFQTATRAQPAAVALSCKTQMKQMPDSSITLSPQRGWQMEGRDIEITIMSDALSANAKHLVCFRWQGGAGEFIQATSARIVPASADPATLKLVATVPGIDHWPVDYAKSNRAPAAEIRVLLADAKGSHFGEMVTTVAIVGANDYCNVPNARPRTDSGTVSPSASKNWQPVGGEIEFTARKSFETNSE